MISGTQWCHIASGQDPTLWHGHGVEADQSLRQWCNYVPFISTLTWCTRGVPDVGVSKEEAVQRHIDRLDSLYVSSTYTPGMIHDIREVVMALEDLITLVKNSNLPTRQIIAEQLVLVRNTGEACGTQLQTYSSNLAGALNMITSSASFTLSIMESRLSRPSWPWYPNTEGEADRAFQQTLQTIELFIHNLVHLNGETNACLETLNSHINGLKHLLGEASELETQEIGHLLGQLWYYVGGHRSRLANANARFETLKDTGMQTKTMQRLVRDVRGDLQDLQISCDILRSYASEPLLTQSSSRGAMHSLANGCEDLRNKMARRSQIQRVAVTIA
ncbi:hypothetical protein B0H11DRAFT_1905075 [Mycena galericulata]|nr:hypothetical protein B0H11DRAFT_1905075 [Mycena galericulata]